MNDFEHLGVWWLPSEPESKVAGVLRFSPASGSELTLVGQLRPSRNLVLATERIVLGETKKL